jgi:glycosyltransferase involved in cell wall biosynthesis
VTTVRNSDRAGGSSAPDVSVVVIFKDAEDFLEEAVESVFAQSFDAWELVLVDDGSSDRSTAVARRWAAENGSHVRYLEHAGHANRGMSASRNLGLAHAAGEFVGFLDADDALVSGALAEQVSILRAHPRVGMVYGPLEYWYGWTGLPEDKERDFVHPTGVSTDRIYEPPELIALFIQNIAFAPSGMLLHRELVERVGGFEESFRDLYEDQVFAAKICRSTPVYISGRSWYRYRQHERSCCLVAQRDGRLDASRRPFLEWLVGYLEREGLAGEDAWQLATSELRRWSPRGRFVASLGRTRRFARELATRFGGGTLG